GAIAAAAARGDKDELLIGGPAPYMGERQGVDIGLGNERVELSEERRMIALQRDERVAAVAEYVEIGAVSDPPRDQRVEQCGERLGLIERLSTGNRDAVERSARDFPAPRDKLRHRQVPARIALPGVLRNTALAAYAAALQPDADAAARAEHGHGKMGLVH